MNCISLIIGLIMSFFVGSSVVTATVRQKSSLDSLSHKVPSTEYGRVYRTKRVSSPFPVEIKVKGRNLYVVSDYDQMLPVYKESGVFYGIFHINKGTNWFSGLPSGIYIINNIRITVS